MTTTEKKVAMKLLSLPASSRALLAEKLIESLDETEDSHVEEQWGREARSRYSEIIQKKVSLKSAKTVFSNARKKLK